MKNVGLISCVMLSGMALFYNLSAAPVYAAKLERDGQTVFLYGDYHETHYGDKHGTHEENEKREGKAINAFCAEFECASIEKANKQFTKPLVLCEDEKFAPCNKVYSDKDWDVIWPSWKKMFMYNTCCYAHSLNDHGVQVKSIDPRNIFDLLGYALNYCLEAYSTTNPDRHAQYKKAYEQIKDWSMKKLFEWAICNLKFYAHFASDARAGKIFDEIAATFIKRKDILWKKILVDTGLSREQLDQATAATIGIHINNNNEPYIKLAHWLVEYENLLGRDYNLEAVEAEALWQIVEMKPIYQKIIVIAGAAHVFNLERYLSKLGFKRCASGGQAYKDTYEEAIAARLAFNNAIDANHSSRVHPLDPLDEFGQWLFKKELNTSRDQFCELEDKEISALQNQMYEKKEVATKKINALMPVPLVSFECFQWINEAERTSIKKRPREDDVNLLVEEQLLRTPKKKKKKKNSLFDNF